MEKPRIYQVSAPFFAKGLDDVGAVPVQGELLAMRQGLLQHEAQGEHGHAVDEQNKDLVA